MHGQQNIKICPKHVEIYSKNKFEKLEHIFGFIVRVNSVCWSSEWNDDNEKDAVFFYWDIKQVKAGR